MFSGDLGRSFAELSGHTQELAAFEDLLKQAKCGGRVLELPWEFIRGQNTDFSSVFVIAQCKGTFYT